MFVRKIGVSLSNNLSEKQYFFKMDLTFYPKQAETTRTIENNCYNSLQPYFVYV